MNTQQQQQLGEQFQSAARQAMNMFRNFAQVAAPVIKSTAQQAVKVATPIVKSAAKWTGETAKKAAGQAQAKIGEAWENRQRQQLISPIVSATPTVVPTKIRSATPTPTTVPTRIPTPTNAPSPTGVPLRKEILDKWGENYPYKEDIKTIWKGVDPNKVANVIFGESSFQPNRYHINAPVWQSKTQPATREEWKTIRAQYPSIDVGLTQINTAEAMTNYLTKQGWTYYDLMSDPQKALKAGYDLYSGNIPYTAPGWGNWVAAKGLGY